MRCEVVGWVLVDPNQSQIWVREANGQVHSERAASVQVDGDSRIQTGAFRRGKRIVDPVTRETLGYEMQWLSSADCMD